MSDRPLTAPQCNRPIWGACIKKYRVTWVIGDADRDLAEGVLELEETNKANAADEAQYQVAESFDSADTFSKRIKPEQVHILAVEEIE